MHTNGTHQQLRINFQNLSIGYICIYPSLAQWQTKQRSLWVHRQWSTKASSKKWDIKTESIATLDMWNIQRFISILFIIMKSAKLKILKIWKKYVPDVCKYCKTCTIRYFTTFSTFFIVTLYAQSAFLVQYSNFSLFFTFLCLMCANTVKNTSLDSP